MPKPAFLAVQCALIACLAVACAAPHRPATQSHALTAGDGPNGEQVLFLNFDGVNLQRIGPSIADDARMNQSATPDAYAVGTSRAIGAFDPTPYAPTYTAQQAKGFIATRVAGWFADFNVQVVTARPASGRYTMIVIGDVSSQIITFPSGLVGIAPVDCANKNQNDVSFSFSTTVATPVPTTDAERLSALKLIAVTVASGAGSSFGLERVTEPTDIMAAGANADAVGFLSGSHMLSDIGSACASGSTTQDSRALLLANLGPSPVTTPRDFSIATSTDLAQPPTSHDGGGGGGKDIGERCDNSAECASNGTCVTMGTTDYCTIECEPKQSDACPSGFSCDFVEDGYLCVRTSAAASGCSIADRASMPITAAVVLLIVVSIGLRRRRAIGS